MSDEAQTLALSLKEYGFSDLSEALLLFSEKGEGYLPLALKAPFDDAKVYASYNPPLNMENGDIWFDVTEVSFAIKFEPEHKRWITWQPIHAVYNWQYNAFLKLFEFKKRNTLFYSCPDDYLTPRESQKDESQFVTDLYFFEASAYCHWFNKSVYSATHCFVYAIDRTWSQEMATYGEKYYWSNYDYDYLVAYKYKYKDFSNDLAAFNFRKEKQDESLVQESQVELWHRSENIHLLSSYETQRKWVPHSKKKIKPFRFSEDLKFKNLSTRL